MTVFLILLLIFLISFILALRSMGDFKTPEIIKHVIESKRLKGTIVFFKDEVKRYSSSSSSVGEADDIKLE